MPRVAGDEASPLPAGTPFGPPQRSKLSDPASFQRSLLAANEHFSSDNQIRDFQVPGGEGYCDDSSTQTPCLRPMARADTPAVLVPVKENSNPFTKASPELTETRSFVRPPPKLASLPCMMKKTMSTQYDDQCLEKMQIRQSVVGVIEEINSNEEHHTKRDSLTKISVANESSSFQRMT